MKIKLIHFALKRFPIDTKTPVGYSVAVFAEYIIVGYEYLVIACTLALGSGAFWYAVSATKEFKRILYSVSDQAREKENRTNEMKMLIAEFIYSHGIVKQLSMPMVFKLNAQ